MSLLFNLMLASQERISIKWQQVRRKYTKFKKLVKKMLHSKIQVKMWRVFFEIWRFFSKKHQRIGQNIPFSIFIFFICEKFHTHKMQYNYIIKFQPIFLFTFLVSRFWFHKHPKRLLANGNVENQWRKFYVLNLEQFDFCKIVCIVSILGNFNSFR